MSSIEKIHTLLNLQLLGIQICEHVFHQFNLPSGVTSFF